MEHIYTNTERLQEGSGKFWLQEMRRIVFGSPQLLSMDEGWHYIASYLPVCRCPASGDWGGWCRTTARDAQYERTAAPPTWLCVLEGTSRKTRVGLHHKTSRQRNGLLRIFQEAGWDAGEKIARLWEKDNISRIWLISCCFRVSCSILDFPKIEAVSRPSPCLA